MRRSISPFASFPPPLKSMCSTQWVEPVIPGRSFREPIRYVTHVERALASGIGRRITLSPLSRDSTWVAIRAAGTGPMNKELRGRRASGTRDGRGPEDELANGVTAAPTRDLRADDPVGPEEGAEEPREISAEEVTRRLVSSALLPVRFQGPRTAEPGLSALAVHLDRRHGEPAASRIHVAQMVHDLHRVLAAGPPGHRADERFARLLSAPVQQVIRRGTQRRPNLTEEPPQGVPRDHDDRNGREARVRGPRLRRELPKVVDVLNRDPTEAECPACGRGLNRGPRESEVITGQVDVRKSALERQQMPTRGSDCAGDEPTSILEPALAWREVRP